MFLAETIWQQQEGTLMSIESWLILATVGIGILLIIGICILEAKLGRTNRIARELLGEQKKANALLQKLADLEKAAKEEGAQRKMQLPPLPRTPPSSEAATGKEVYRID